MSFFKNLYFGCDICYSEAIVSGMNVIESMVSHLKIECVPNFKHLFISVPSVICMMRYDVDKRNRM